ncbi:Hexokinase-1 [Podosphaera aphanis]|nr:Hexokinase-1 [Podosphaera aphanis]
MLPSFNHQLPTGKERGEFIALDIGGTTFRVAIVKLCGESDGARESKILGMKSFKIISEVRKLKGIVFFHWIAAKIEEVLAEHGHSNVTPMSMGVSWSFPIEQTSHRSGRLMKMGKGFHAADGLLNQDLGSLIQQCCQARGLNIQLQAIVNDSSATLLSRAYMDSATRFSLIVGTGVNAAVHLPVHLFNPSKFGTRPSSWHDSATHVIVNTEISMLGKDLLPTTEWDEKIRFSHPNPDFQPLEFFVSGAYLGEIARLILVDGIKNVGLFGGVVPSCLRGKYTLGTETISHIQRDQSKNLAKARRVYCEKYPLAFPPTYNDLQALRHISSNVIHRASGLVAAGIHALWQLRNEVEHIAPQNYSHIVVAYNGSVIESYPGFRDACQHHLDTLVQATGGVKGMVRLVYAMESGLIGAAVASAVAL